MNAPPDSLYDLTANCMLRDQFRFHRRFTQIKQQKNNKDQARQWAKLERDINASALIRSERLASLPTPTFSEQLKGSEPFISELRK